MGSRTKIKKSTDDDQKVGRLSDMDTREVSLVDAAANKRTFLVIKRDAGAGSDSDSSGDDSSEDDAEVGKQEPKKTEAGKEFPAGAFAFVPEPDKPSTWKLKLFDEPADVPDKPSVRLTAAAAAALGPGFRGQKVKLPADARESVKQKVRAAWLKARRLAGNDDPEADLPNVLKEDDVDDVDDNEIQKRVVGARVEEVLTRVQSIKTTVETAKATDETEGTMPIAVGREIRAAQFLLKGVAGVTKGVSLLIPSGELGEVSEIELAVQKGTLKILDEVERRLETMKADLADADMVDPTQAREIDGCADLLGKAITDYPTTKSDTVLVIVKSSLSDEARADLLSDIEKAMGELGEIYMALSTDAVAKSENLAGESEIGAAIHASSAVLEGAVAKMMGDTERADLGKAVELVRELKLSMIDKSGQVVMCKAADGSSSQEEMAKAVIGVLVPIAKASQMFQARWNHGGGDVVLATSDEKIVSFDSFEEAEMEALKRNIELVTKVAKQATVEVELEKRFQARQGGTKGYQVINTETDEVVWEGETQDEANAEANRRNLERLGGKKDTKKKEDDMGAEATVDTSKVGRPMKSDRLNRLTSAAKMLKDALGDMQAGSLSMEKFKKAADVLAEIILEVQTAKAAQLARGMDPDDLGSDDRSTPNHGSGVQPDTTATNAAAGLAGEGTPDLSDVLKSVKGLKADRESDKATIAKLEGQVTQLRKQRQMPATVPADAGGEIVDTKKRLNEEKVSWSADMNNESWGDED